MKGYIYLGFWGQGIQGFICVCPYMVICPYMGILKKPITSELHKLEG